MTPCQKYRNPILAIYLAGIFLPGTTFAAVFLSTLVLICLYGAMSLREPRRKYLPS